MLGRRAPRSEPAGRIHCTTAGTPCKGCVNPARARALAMAPVLHNEQAVIEEPRVLVVDDDLPLARNIAYLLSPLGVHAEVAGTAKEARERAAARPFDVALLDIHLPDGDGVELGARLQEESPGSEVVFITGQATLAAAAKAVGLGAAGMLVKPFQPAHLVDSVSRALARKREASRALERRVRSGRMETLARLCVGLAHELRNPLNSALLQLQLGTRRLNGDPARPARATAECIDVATGELQRLARILTEFEACIQPARLELESTPVEQLVAGALPELPAAPPIEVRRELAPGMLVHVDRKRMETALANLVQNAIEAMPAGGTVTLRAFVDGDRAVLEVEDTGVGIPAADVIFDPFFSTKPFGTGLGLALVHRIVLDHGGRIDVASRPGRTTFSISLGLPA